MTNQTISSFTGEHEFLSNFYHRPMSVGTRMDSYATVEHAYQAMKCADENDMLRIRLAPSPGMAKKIGRHITLRSDWESIKFQVMEGLLRNKFLDHQEMGDKLIATAPHILIEGNTWHDQIWGDCMCLNHATTPGLNALGTLLMAVRLELLSRQVPTGGIA